LDTRFSGYYGAIAEGFHATLVSTLARARPDWEFVLVGSTLVASYAPPQRPNVHMLGEKPYDDLRRYLLAFDMDIIPFKQLPLTEATNPVKLFEYASAGKPIVATDLSELRNYQEYATLASNTLTWLQALDSALLSPDHSHTLNRGDFDRRNTWNQRLA
jgi:O-antigen biosynthesis protein